MHPEFLLQLVNQRLDESRSRAGRASELKRALRFRSGSASRQEANRASAPCCLPVAS